MCAYAYTLHTYTWQGLQVWYWRAALFRLTDRGIMYGGTELSVRPADPHNTKTGGQWGHQTVTFAHTRQPRHTLTRVPPDPNILSFLTMAVMLDEAKWVITLWVCAALHSLVMVKMYCFRVIWHSQMWLSYYALRMLSKHFNTLFFDFPFRMEKSNKLQHVLIGLEFEG